jgi:hypothetical protein
MATGNGAVSRVSLEYSAAAGLGRGHTVVDLPKTALESFEVELASLVRIELGPKMLNPGIALILRLAQAMLHLADQLGRAHSGGIEGRF